MQSNLNTKEGSMQDSGGGGSKQRRHQHSHHAHCRQSGSPDPRQQQTHSPFDASMSSRTVVAAPSVRKKCPTSGATSCYNYKRSAGLLNTSASVSCSVSTTGDNCRSDFHLHAAAQPNKSAKVKQAEQRQEESEQSDCVALRRSFSQLAQGSRPSSTGRFCGKSRTQSQSSTFSTSFEGAAAAVDAAADSAGAADPFAYQDRYPYNCCDLKRMSAANNSRRSSRIKLPSTRAESRDEGNYFYPADSLKLYGHVNCELPDDESDSGASSLPSSNGSTLNSSCASIDLVRCNRAAFEASSGSPQHRRISISDEQQLAQHSSQPHQPLHPQHHQQPHLAEFTKFKNDSGSFTDSEMSPEFRGCTPDKDATPTKTTQRDDADESAETADLADASMKSRSTLNSVITVIERPRRSSQQQQQQQQQQLVLLPQSDSDDDNNDGGSRHCRLRRSNQQQQQHQQHHSSDDRSSSSTLDGDEEVPASLDDENGASAAAAAAEGSDDCDGAASEASDLTSVSAAGAGSDFSLIRSQLQYDFNTWDRPTIRTFGIRVREIQRPPSETVIAAWSDAELLERIRQLSRLRGAAARLNPATRQFSGRVRVHVNLIRPIRMGRTELPQLVPRGHSRLLQLTSAVRSQEVVQALLNALQVKEQAYKFALYEHSIEGDKSVTFRRLHPTESPLALVLSWLHGIPSGEPTSPSFDEAGKSVFERKKIVLQENDSGLVNWSAFSVPELSNFLQILQREESEYRDSIQLKYLLLKREMRRRIRQLDRQKLALEDDWA